MQLLNQNYFNQQDEVPIWQAIKQRSLQPLKNQFSLKQFGKAVGNPAAIMGSVNMESPFVKGSNYIRQADIGGIKEFEGEMAKYSQYLKNESLKRVREQARQAFQSRQQEAFNRAHSGFDITKLFK